MPPHRHRIFRYPNHARATIEEQEAERRKSSRAQRRLWRQRAKRRRLRARARAPNAKRKSVPTGGGSQGQARRPNNVRWKKPSAPRRRPSARQGLRIETRGRKEAARTTSDTKNRLTREQLEETANQRGSRRHTAKPETEAQALALRAKAESQKQSLAEQRVRQAAAKKQQEELDAAQRICVHS